MDRLVSLSLTDAERGALSALGVVADDRGVLRSSSSGAEVAAATAALLLAKSGSEHGVRPGEFDRGPLTEGHAAANAETWTTGVPDRLDDNRDAPEPAKPKKGKRGKRGRVMDAQDASNSSSSGGGGTSGGHYASGSSMKAAMDPQSFSRRYLSAGHEADSPANSGARGTVGLPESHPAEAQRFDRGPLTAGHEKPSPGDQGDNNPHAPGAPAAEVYATGRSAYEMNQAKNTADHLAQTGSRIDSAPSPARWSPSPDLRAASVPQPHSATSALVGRAPGE